MTAHDEARGGGRLTRSETVTVRLDPKLRYLAELAARKQRRTLSSYIEWAIEDSLHRAVLHETAKKQTTVADEAATLWDVEVADRFVKLAFRYPELLTHDEQVRWKLIRENGALWKGDFDGPGDEWTWQVCEDSLKFDVLRRHWDAFSGPREPGVGRPVWLLKKPAPPDAATTKRARRPPSKP